MSIPKMTLPEFFTELPTTKEKVKYRPFTVAEEKVLLIALEGGEDLEIQNAIFNIVNACTMDDIDFNKRPMCDLEWMFLHIRGKSINDQIDLVLTHPSDVNCEHETEMMLPIANIKCEIPDIDSNIKLTDDYGVELKWPTVAYNNTADNFEGTEYIIDVIANHIVSVYDADEVYSDFTVDEAKEWVLSLTTPQFESIQEFFSQTPQLNTQIEWTCEACGAKESVSLSGLGNFFAFA
tara:strand:+ start:214 stop:921 length:708 start_codon:yes stop_codon:yes gene_type:complete